MSTDQLQGRTARCHCGKEKPSTEKKYLAFFQYRGPGSETAKKSCKNCNFHEVAHGKNYHKCQNFEPMPEGKEFDSYYCGCNGWD